MKIKRRRYIKNNSKFKKSKKVFIKNILVLSSLIFSTNIVTSFIYKNYVYSVLFVFLTITSVIYHSNANYYTNILDKLGIVLIVSYGTYNVYSKFDINKIIIVSIIIILFLLTLFLYIYGYVTKQFCFHNQLCIGNKYHSLLHCISSFAHHLITIM